ncbi:sodium:calcium antiporter [Haladaptatus paucihalophilus]|uniref:sodium:calcium antiporter n=1 Tax=Haladaptatus paucihalophilus TaxID=367189 RepID=UPI000674CC27|nr:sodium:proton exchanger [Haladaptatus paucihalophilus]
MNPIPTVPLAILPPVWENSLLLLASFLLLLLGAEVFTNAVEWLGHRLGVSESATGSILAAVGTALPETTIPIIAIFGSGGGTKAAEEVGVGAILGAPFMLVNFAMFLVGTSVLYFRTRRSNGQKMHFNNKSTRRDLSFFLVGYTLAFSAALIHSDTISHGIAALLVLLYLFYLYRSLKSGELVEGEELDDLHLGLMIEGLVPGMSADDNHSGDPHSILVAVQTLVALGLIIGGAQVFVSQTQWVSEEVLGIPTAIVALLIAPLATELPEKFNSIIWISRDKDTLALGNISGAMAFQGTLPVTLGIMFTSWDLSFQWGTAGFLNGLSAILAIISGCVLYFRARRINGSKMTARPFLIGGLFYLIFLAVVVYHVVVLNVGGISGH